MMMVGGEDSVTLPERDAQSIYNRLAAAPKALAIFENGGHYLFVDNCNALALQFDLFSVCSDAVWDMNRAHDLTNHLATAFLRATFYEDAEAAAMLAPGTVDFTGVTYQYSQNVVETLIPQVISERPHDPRAFTQGLLLYDGLLYESTGQYGASSLREVDPITGEVLRQFNLNASFFGEGLEKVDDRLIQLTWRENAAIVFDFETLEVVGAFQYDGEGWGLCYDGVALYMTDGSNNLYQRDPQTFNVLEVIPVTLRGEPVFRLNELECVDDVVYANVWMTDDIMRINKFTGEITAVIDASGLLSDEELENADVLNGIAYDLENDVFLITGKYWPILFEVRFVPTD